MSFLAKPLLGSAQAKTIAEVRGRIELFQAQIIQSNELTLPGAAWFPNDKKRFRPAQYKRFQSNKSFRESVSPFPERGDLNNPDDLNGENVSMAVNRPPLGFRADRFVLIVEKRDQTCLAKALELVGNNPMSFEATVIRPQAAP